MADHRVSVAAVERPIVLNVQDEKIILQINNEPVVVQFSGKGPAGAPGASVVSVEKTGSSGLVDTYTITMTTGAQYSFQVTNGEKGDPGEIAAYVIEEEEALVLTPDIENYEGEYTVIPTTSDQRLETTGLMMQGDVNVEEIPYSETSNQSGGFTASIGG